MQLLALLSLLFTHYVLIGESFVLAPLGASRWTTGVQQRLSTLSLCASKKPFSQAVERTFELDELYEDINDNKHQLTLTLYHTAKPDYLMSCLEDKLISMWTCGNSLTNFDAESMDLSHHTQKDAAVDEFLAKMGHADAVPLLVRKVTSNTPLSKYFFDTLNTFLVKYINTPESGETNIPAVLGQYRNANVSPNQPQGALKEYTPADQIEAQMNELIEFCNNPPEEMHPIEVATLAHLQFLRIQPYQAGNVREAHLLLGYLLVRNGMALATVEPHSSEYNAALQYSQVVKGTPVPLIEWVGTSVYNATCQIDHLVSSGLRHDF